MTITDQFIGHELEFCATRPVGVVERLISDDKAAAITGRPGIKNLAPMLVKFDITSGQANIASLNLYPANHGSGTTCYFLPYERDSCTIMTIGGGADYFFTSSLSGCSVQVHGPMSTPTIAHANAGQAYEDALNEIRTKASDAAATLTAQTAIDVMLPNPGGAAYVGVVRKRDYRNKLNKGSLKFGKLQASAGKFSSSTKLAGTYKPLIGAFVFGKREGTSWNFYYQASVGIQGTTKTSLFSSSQALLTGFEVSLGMPTPFYPFAG